MYQKLLHRSEQTSRTTMNYTGKETYVKKDYMLSQECVTVSTQMSSQADALAPAPEFVFKVNRPIPQILQCMTK